MQGDLALMRVSVECEGCGHVSEWLENPRVGPQYVLCGYCGWAIVAALTDEQSDKAHRDIGVKLLGRRVPKHIG